MRAAKNQELAALLPLLPSSDAVRRECAALTDAGCLEDCCEVYRYFSSRVEIVDEAAIQAIFARPGTLLFEGAQGVLLDENYGFAPYTTWSTTTAANAETLLRENDYAGSIFRLGVMRTYTTRHGAGPFPTEDDELTRLMPEAHNGWNEWQREFRAGYCDLVAARYARDVVGAIDGLAVTHVDRLALPPRLPLSRDTAALTSCFDHTGNQILAIRVHQPPDLAHQENLTGMLGLCVPEYQELPLSSSQVMTEDDQMACCSFIAESLTLPLAITSHGPTASDKLCVVNIMPGSDSSLA